VYADAKGRYFVASEWGSAILVYDQNGAHIATVPMEPGSAGGAPRLDGIVADANDSLYVLDNANRRIAVVAPDWSIARYVSLPFSVSAFWVLRDGRFLSSRDTRGRAEPLVVHSSSGEVLRAFGMALNADGTPCVNCGAPLATVMSSGYRVMLAWKSQYRLEEWDLAGRQTAVFSAPSAALDALPFGVRMAMGSAADSVDNFGRRDEDVPGLRRMRSFADGSLWLELLVRDFFGRLATRVDILDVTRGVLTGSIPDFSLDDVVTEGIRADYRVDERGFPIIQLFRFEIEGRGG
jgi:hypothetical protein